MIYDAEDTNKKLKVRVLAFCGSGNGPIVAVCCPESGRLYTTEVENILVPGEKISFEPLGGKAKPGTPPVGKRK